MADYRTLTSMADIEEGVAALVAREPRFARVVERCGLPSLRKSEPGLAGLLRIVTEQMISLKAAEAIWMRIEASLAPFDHSDILRRRHATLMKLGLTNHKARCFRVLAEAVRDGSLPLHQLHELSDDEIQKKLTQLHGIGNWTAEIYLLSCLGRSDVWPAGDIALQAAAQDLFSLGQRPSEKELRLLAESWRPWRAVAARLLWAHYRFRKGVPQAET